jgi:ankyrin repeat protein
MALTSLPTCCIYTAQAVNAGNIFMVRLLCDAGASVDFSGKSGKFPLYVAAKSQHGTDILKLLIERGANLNLKYMNGLWRINFSVEVGIYCTRSLSIDCDSQSSSNASFIIKDC